MQDFNLKIIIFAGLITLVLLVFYSIVGRSLKSIHSSKTGQDSWTRSISSFIIVFTVIVAVYQLVFGTVDAILVGTLLTLGITGKVVNSKINE